MPQSRIGDLGIKKIKLLEVGQSLELLHTLISDQPAPEVTVSENKEPNEIEESDQPVGAALAAIAGRSYRRPHFYGLAFEAQRVARFTPQPWDIALDAVITERAVYRPGTR